MIFNLLVISAFFGSLASVIVFGLTKWGIIIGFISLGLLYLKPPLLDFIKFKGFE